MNILVATGTWELTGITVNSDDDKLYYTDTNNGIIAEIRTDGLGQRRLLQNDQTTAPTAIYYEHNDRFQYSEQFILHTVGLSWFLINETCIDLLSLTALSCNTLGRNVQSVNANHESGQLNRSLTNTYFTESDQYWRRWHEYCCST